MEKKFNRCASNLFPWSLIFSIIFNDLWSIETTTFCNYADDNTLYSEDKNANIVVSRLKHDFPIISEWFYKNYKIINTEKYHFLTVNFNEPFKYFPVSDSTIENFTEDKILRIVIDNKLIFSIKANQKLSALSIISKLATLNQPK